MDAFSHFTSFSLPFSDYPEPSVLKTEYLLERAGGAYSLVEVIPGQAAAMYATLSYPMKYELLDVTTGGNTTFDLADTTDYTLPSECSNEQNLPATAPRNFFCINENTGRIYTTSAIAGKLNSDVELRFQVRISNTTIYPIRDQTVNLVLTSIDPCKEARPLYENLGDCVKYPSMPLTKFEENSFHFELPSSYQRIIAMKVPLSTLRLQSGAANRLNISTSIEGLVNGTVTFQYNTPFELYYTEDVSLFINTPISYVGAEGVKSIKVTLTEGGSETEIEIIKTENATDISLQYFDQFACTSACKTQFENWKSVVAELPINCQKDRMYYHRNFDVCTGI